MGKFGDREWGKSAIPVRLWVRAILAEEYGVRWSDVTWVTSEGSHSDEYTDPDNVVRTDKSLKDELRSGGIVAAILGGQADPDMSPLVPDPAAAALRWYQRNGTVPINHMVVVKRDLLESNPSLVQQAYSYIGTGIDQALAAGTAPHAKGLPTAIRHGRDAVRRSVEMAAAAAFDQRMISKPVPDLDRLFAF